MLQERILGKDNKIRIKYKSVNFLSKDVTFQVNGWKILGHRINIMCNNLVLKLFVIIFT